MDDTGRLSQPLRPEAAALLWGASDDSILQPRRVLERVTEIDRAHIVMLEECALIDAGEAGVLLTAIDHARSDGFEAVLGRPRPRGLYTAWEDHLRSLDDRAGGMLHLGRSRNDLNATEGLLAMREVWIEGGAAVARALDAMLAASARHHRTVLPIATNGQPAAPITLAHWLAAVGLAFGRDLDAWRVSGECALQRCPLGACAVAGTSLPIDASRTADLLGFAMPLVNSVDAVTSRDGHLRLLSAVVSATATAARVAHTLASWADSAVGFIRLPDDLSGASSYLPQKRNAFLLEHVAAAAPSALASFVAASTVCAGAPFTNSAAVSSDLPKALDGALAAMTRSLALTAMMIEGMEVDQSKMRQVAGSAFTTAAFVAEQAVRKGITFRAAHEAVGQLVSRLELAGRTLDDVDCIPELGDLRPVVDPEAAVAEVRSLGGSTPTALAAAREQIELAQSQWHEGATAARSRWRQAAADLDGRASSLRSAAGVVL
jgi:argininosuccinate lyase